MSLTIFDKNIQSMLKRDKEFSDKFLYLKQDQSFLNGINQETDSILPGSEIIDGRTVLYVQTNNNIYQLDSLYNSKIIMDLWCEQIDSKNFNTKLIMFGLGNAMYIRAFLNKVPYTERIIVYEPSFMIFNYMFDLFDFRDLIDDSRILFYVEDINGCPKKEILYHYLNFQDIGSILFLDYINYIKMFPKQYNTFFVEVQKTINTINAMDYVWERFGTAYYHNTLSNFPYLLKSYSLSNLSNLIPAGIPAILVSAGPSLDKNIQYIQSAEGRAFIVAVDSALNALLKRDIVPDLFVTVDGKKMEAHFQDERIKKIPMVCNLVSNMNVISNHMGKQFFISDRNEHIDKILNAHAKRLPIVESGGSVANSAYSLLELMGFKTIILIGQDLAYTDNRTHAADTVRGSWNMDITGEKIIELEGYYDEVVKSSNEFWIYLEWFENEIQRRKDVTMINATEGGAKIHGALQMSFQEAVKTYCNQEFNTQEIFDRTEKWLTKEETSNIVRDFKNIVEEVLSIRKNAENAILIYRKMIEKVHAEKYKSKDFFEMYNKTKAITEKIEQTDALYYIDCMMQDKMKQITNDIYVLKEDEKEDLAEGITRGLEYMKAIVQTVNEVLPDMKKKIDDGIQKIGC